MTSHLKLHVDFNAEHRGGWFSVQRTSRYTLKPGQIVQLDDGEGTRCKGEIRNPQEFISNGRAYASVVPVDGTFEHYEAR